MTLLSLQRDTVALQNVPHGDSVMGFRYLQDGSIPKNVVLSLVYGIVDLCRNPHRAMLV